MNAVKILNNFILAMLMLSGIITQWYSKGQNKFVYSKLLLLHSIMMTTGFTYFYGKIIYDDYKINQFDLKDAGKLHSHMSVVVAIVNYITGILIGPALTRLLNAQSLYKSIEYFKISKELLKAGVLISVIKIILFPLVIVVALVLSNSSQKTKTWTVSRIFPLLMSNIFSNCFFGALIMCRTIVAAMNERLAEIVKEVNFMQSEEQMQLHDPYYRMQRCCDLADKIDILAERYSAIIKKNLYFLDLVSVPFLCSILCNLVGITAGLFTQYMAIADKLINNQYYDVFKALTNAIFVVIAFSETSLQAYTCDSNLTTVHETGVILQRMTLTHTDVRFKRSVETLSLAILTHKYKVQPLGLVEINISLVYEISSAVANFLLILIQSDLTIRFSY